MWRLCTLNELDYFNWETTKKLDKFLFSKTLVSFDNRLSQKNVLISLKNLKSQVCNFIHILYARVFFVQKFVLNGLYTIQSTDAYFRIKKGCCRMLVQIYICLLVLFKQLAKRNFNVHNKYNPDTVLFELFKVS